MTVKLDLHVHTRYSGDSCLSLEKLIKGLKKRGLDGVAVTDHNTLKGALRLKEIAPPWVTVITGEEIKTREGEITGLFLSEEIPSDLSPEKTIARIRSQGGLVCVPHPFDRLRRFHLKTEALLRILDQVDMIEVFNSRNFFRKYNSRAHRFAEMKRITACVGSDAHCLYELGRSFVEMESFSSPGEFLENLRFAELTMKKSNLWPHLLTMKEKYLKFNFGNPGE